MLVNKVIFLPENDLLIKSVISIHRRFKFSTNIQRPNCFYPPTPDRRQSKTFLTIDERHRRQGIWTPPPLLNKNKNIGFPKQYWSGSPENHKATNVQVQHSMLGHHRPASETPCGVSLAGRWWPAYCGIWILSSPLINLKKSCQSWTPSPGSAHERR